MNNKRLFVEKLAYYASREPKKFVQVDRHYLPGGHDTQMGPPDGDGDVITAQTTVELMRGATVRVLLPHDTDPKVAVRQLKKLAKYLKRDPKWLEYARPNGQQINDFLPF